MSVFLSSDRLRRFVLLALVAGSAALAVAAYLQALHFPFVYDDLDYVTNNAKLTGLHGSDLWRLFIEPYNRLEFLPLRDLSYWFDIAAFGLAPAAFRIHSIILYLLCIPLVYVVTLGVWRYFRPAQAGSAQWAAAAVTALFAVHPAHVEAVVWISGRKDVLSTLFSLLALWLAISARRDSGLSVPHAVAALLALLAALLSKGAAVAVAPIMALLWLLFWRDIPAAVRHRSTLLWPLASLLLAAVAAMVFSSFSAIKESVPFGIDALQRMLAISGWLARLSVDPGAGHLFYPVLERPYLMPMVALGVAVSIAALACAVILLRKRSLEAFAVSAFVLLCLPYMQLFPFGTGSLVADRWLLLASWPAVLLLAALAFRLHSLPRAVLLLAIAVLWIYQTVERPRDWRSAEALIDADLRAYPGFYYPAMHKIAFQLRQGMTQQANETAATIPDAAMRAIALRLVGADHAVHTEAVAAGDPRAAMNLLGGLGRDLAQMPAAAKLNKSIDGFWSRGQILLRTEWVDLSGLFPGNALARYNAAVASLFLGDNQAAATGFRAVTESPQFPDTLRGRAFKNLGFALLNSGDAGAAEAPLRAALEQSPPDLGAYCLLAKVYRQTRRPDQAARADIDCRTRAPIEGTSQ